MIGNPLEESHAQLQQAKGLLRERKFDQAQAICEALLRRYPNYVGALYTLGLVYGEQDRNEHALDCLVRALMLSPRNKPVATALAEIYLRLGANEMAAQTLERAAPSGPPDAAALLMLGDIYQEDCQYERARDKYRQALAVEPDLASAAIGLGWCHGHLGDYGEAARTFAGLIERGVNLIEPVRALTILPASAVKVDLLAQLEKLAKPPGEDEADFANSVDFLRAAILDRRGHYAEAWECLTRANRAVFLKMHDRLGPIAERWRDSLDMLRANPGRRGRTDATGHPISLFILGASRSGKTTTEGLVATLNGVKRGYESPCLRDAILRTFQAGSLLGAAALEHLPPHLYPLCREYYVEELGRRAGSARVFTNSAFGQIYIAALISDMLPNVRFLFVKRDVEDNVFRIFMTKYRSGNAYAYDLKAAREHVVQHHEMIDLMAEKFPDIVRVVRYEDVVTDPAAARAVAAELCGLPIPDEMAVPAVDSDRGCSAPYRERMAIVLKQ